ncbi:MAG TPA: hypothetical protein VFZ19_08175, partial [Solirubrobacterales bacterium]
FGPLRLGSSPTQLLQAAGQPSRRVDRSFRWCSSLRKAKGARRPGVAVVFDQQGQAAFIATTAGGKGKPKRARKLGRGLFVVRKGKGGDRIWGYRKGKLRFRAVAAPGIAAKPGRALAAFRASGLGK